MLHRKENYLSKKMSILIVYVLSIVALVVFSVFFVTIANAYEKDSSIESQKEDIDTSQQVKQDSDLSKIKRLSPEQMNELKNNPMDGDYYANNLPSSDSYLKGNENGTNTLGSVLGFTRNDFTAWLYNHWNGYYLGTPYEGYIHKSPLGDLSAWGTSGQSYPSANCSGFVWHTLVGAHVQAGGAPNPYQVPNWSSDSCSGGGWVNFCAQYDIERYEFGSVDQMFNSGVLEPGDIVWVRESSWEYSSLNDHVLIFWGNTYYDNCFIHCLDKDPVNGVGMSQLTTWGNIGTLNVIKLEKSQGGIQMEKKSSRSWSENDPDYSYKDGSCVYSIFTSPDCSGTSWTGVNMTIDRNGHGQTSNKALKSGMYYVQEDKNAHGKNYLWNGEIGSVYVYSNQINSVRWLNGTSITYDTPINKPLDPGIKDGYYLITSKLNSNKVADVAGAGLSSGTNIHLWDNNNGANQSYYVHKLKNGFYQIVNELSGKAMDVEAARAISGTNVQQWDKSESNKSEQWLISKNENDNTYVLINHATGLALDVCGAGTSNGTNIDVYATNKTPAQSWNLKKIKSKREELDELASKYSSEISDGIYTIKSLINDNFVLDLNGASHNDFSNIQLFNKNGTNAQKWKVSHDSKGYVTFTSIESGKVLDVYCANWCPGNNVNQYSGNNSYAQKWVVVPCDNNKFKIVSALKMDVVLDVNNGIAANCSNVQIYASNNTNAQKWIFKNE